MKPAVKLAKYRQVFCEEFSLSFFKPKKDQCPVCNIHENSQKNGTIDPETENKYKAHQDRKVEKGERKRQGTSTKRRNILCSNI